MKQIKDMIETYDGLIAYHTQRVKDWEEKISVIQTENKGLELALKAIAHCQPAVDSIEHRIDDNLRYVLNHRRFLDEAKDTLISITSARKFFIEVMQKHCEHDMVFDHTDYHKNEDYYKCTICGTTQ